MRIAAITIYCNEWFRLDNWINLYQIYQNEIDLHIIINNGIVEDNSILSEKFPNSKIIFSDSKNMTLCYNLGVKEALLHPEIDVIIQITNDVKFEKGTLTRLYHKLMQDHTLAIIGPVMLKKDSDYIESFGYNMVKSYGDFNPLYHGLSFNELKEDFKYVSFVPGGAMMIKRSAYEEIGLQDENLHMYCDEMDIFMRLDQAGYKEGVLCSAKAWHQHIFKPGTTKRSSLASFLTARNRIYITRKYNNEIIVLYEFLRLYMRYILKYLMAKIKMDPYATSYRSAIRGLVTGYKNNMNNNFEGILY